MTACGFIWYLIFQWYDMYDDVESLGECLTSKSCRHRNMLNTPDMTLDPIILYWHWGNKFPFPCPTELSYSKQGSNMYHIYSLLKYDLHLDMDALKY